MHDMDFFISEARTAEFAERIAPLGLRWWALGRVDTLMQYRDATWERDGALRPEDDVLRRRVRLRRDARSDEQGRQVVRGADARAGAPHAPLRHRARVLVRARLAAGSAAATSRTTFDFIRAIKQINPATEIVLYTYTPVPLDGSAVHRGDAARVSPFPRRSSEWASPSGEQLSMRRGDGIPWMDAGGVRRRVRNFERVLNAFYPTVTDLRLTGWRRAGAEGGQRLALRA